MYMCLKWNVTQLQRMKIRVRMKTSHDSCHVESRIKLIYKHACLLATGASRVHGRGRGSKSRQSDSYATWEWEGGCWKRGICRERGAQGGPVGGRVRARQSECAWTRWDEAQLLCMAATKGCGEVHIECVGLTCQCSNLSWRRYSMSLWFRLFSIFVVGSNSVPTKQVYFHWTTSPAHNNLFSPQDLFNHDTYSK